MRFKQFIQEAPFIGPSTREITSDEISEFLLDNPRALDHLKKKGPTLFRGMPAENDTAVLYGDSRIFKRKAANTRNFVNIYLPTVPSWKEFPSRQSAFICTTEKRAAGGYGDTFYVIPADNAKIGVCSDEDFWYSFAATLNELSLNIDILNTLIFDLGDVLEINFSEYNGAALRRQFSQIDADEIDDCYDIMDHGMVKRSILQIARLMKKNKLSTLEQFMDYALDAKTNNFKVANDLDDIPDAREAWVSGEAIFIPISHDIDKIIRSVEEK